jgi:hypothetical protein
MNIFQISFICLVAGPAAAQSSNQVYGEACAEAIGAIETFDCGDGVTVPITVDGDVVTGQAPATCDRPALLSNGTDSDGQCVPNSRILDLSTDTMQVTAMCRQKHLRSADSTEFDEIDVIAHNPNSGATCWFQAKADGGDTPVSGVLVPSPTAATDSSFWETPETVVADDCGSCHDNDPFMYSPFVGQVWEHVPTDPFGPYAHVDVGFGFSDWPTHSMDMRNNTCTGCHRIGSGSLFPSDPSQEKPGSCGMLAQWMTGQTIPIGADDWASTYPGSHAMPPDFGRSEDAWNVIYGQSIATIQSCCDDPNQAICGLSEIASYQSTLEIQSYLESIESE